MDFFLLGIDILVIAAFVLFIALVAPHLMRVLKNYNNDLFVQLIPVFALIFLCSLAISIGYGGFQESLFFSFITFISFILLASMLFLTLMIKKRWKRNYDQLLILVPSFLKEKVLILSKTS